MTREDTRRVDPGHTRTHLRGTPDRVIVISGDTAPTEAVVEACGGCDVLVLEVYSADRFRERPPEWQRYHADADTSAREFAALASRARPGV